MAAGHIAGLGRNGTRDSHINRSGAAVQLEYEILVREYLRFVWRGLPLDEVAGAVSWRGQPPVRGGTVDVTLEGRVATSRTAGIWLDLPLTLTLRGTTLQIDGLGATQVDELKLPFGLRGPLGAPRISFDGDRLADALIAAGKQELAKQVRGRALSLLDKHAPGVPSDVRDVIQGKPLGEVVDHKKAELEAAAKREAEAAKQKAAEEAKKAAEKELLKRFGGKDTAVEKPTESTKKAADEAIKKGLGGLLGGKK